VETKFSKEDLEGVVVGAMEPPKVKLSVTGPIHPLVAKVLMNLPHVELVPQESLEPPVPVMMTGRSPGKTVVLPAWVNVNDPRGNLTPKQRAKAAWPRWRKTRGK
jgi:hypothetical protein